MWAYCLFPAAAKNLKPAPQTHKKHYALTALEEAIALAMGTAWYWIDHERQVADWDFPAWQERLTLDVVRYDNNPFHVNFAWHAGNGAGFHAIARVNGLSVSESFAASLLTSLVWEYALEYREKVSANDLLFTTGAGFPLGELVYSMGQYIHEDPDAPDSPWARWTLGFPRALSDVIHGVSKKRASVVNAAPLWHRMRLHYAASRASAKVGQQHSDFYIHTIGLEGEFVRIPGFRDVGKRATFFHNAEATRGDVAGGLAPSGSSFRVFAEAQLLGYHWQDLSSEHDVFGYSHTLSLPLAYRYRREEVGSWDERIGVLHLPGLSWDALYQRGALSLETRVRVHPDFAGVNALSYPQWETAYPQERGKSILRKMGYYYGYGVSASFDAQLRYHDFSVGASLWKASYRSDQGLDRSQEALTTDQKTDDSIQELRATLRYEGLPGNTFLAARFQSLSRDSRLEEFLSIASLHRVTLEFGIGL